MAILSLHQEQQTAFDNQQCKTDDPGIRLPGHYKNHRSDNGYGHFGNEKNRAVTSMTRIVSSDIWQGIRGQHSDIIRSQVPCMPVHIPAD